MCTSMYVLDYMREHMRVVCISEYYVYTHVGVVCVHALAYVYMCVTCIHECTCMMFLCGVFCVVHTCVSTCVSVHVHMSICV